MIVFLPTSPGSLSGGKCSGLMPVTSVTCRRALLRLWRRKNILNTPVWLGSTQCLRFLFISTPSITTAYSDDLFTYLSPYVIFFILSPHLLVLALKFLCHRNKLLACFALRLHPLLKGENGTGITEYSRPLIMNCQTFPLFDTFYNISYSEDPTASDIWNQKLLLYFGTFVLLSEE